jgi:FdhD protein
MNKNAQVAKHSVSQVNKVVIKNQHRQLVTDTVISEQPLQITLIWHKSQHQNQQEHSQVFSITMRTPGDDQALILGLLMSEGVINTASDVNDISPQSTQEENNNLWDVTLRRGIVPELSSLERYQMTYSSCGLCGTTSLKSLELKNPPVLSDKKHSLAMADIVLMPNRMRAQQSLFKITGGSHAAALFKGATLVDIREDIGRHNAVDKLFGALLASQCHEKTVSNEVLACLVSGRVSFEIVQKTVMAGIAILIAVGAPSDLAIVAAKRFNLTLIGFTSGNGFNIYHGEWRLLPLEE